MSISGRLRGGAATPRLPRNVVALGLVSLLNDASSEIIYPLLPVFMTATLGASLTFVGLVEGAAESTSSLLKLPSGWLSDRFRRRKPLVVAGYGLATATRPLLALATAGWHVLGLRFLDRVGKGVRTAPRDALIAESAPSGARGLAFGFHRAMDHAGAILGALLAAGLIWYFKGDYRTVFWAASVPALAAIAVLLLAVRESRAPGPSPAGPGAGAGPLGGEFKKYLGVLLIFTLGNSSDAFLLLRAQQSGVEVAVIPLLWAWLHLSKAMSSVVGGGLSDRFGRVGLITGGWLLYAAIYAGFAAGGGPGWVWALFGVYGVYFGLTEGAERALVADLVPAEVRGTAFGFYNLVIGVAALPASLMVGFLWQRFGAEAALLTGAGLSLLAAVLLLMLRPAARQ
jgi:MFS family permease